MIRIKEKNKASYFHGSLVFYHVLTGFWPPPQDDKRKRKI